RGEKGVDRVGLPAPFAELLEQARAHPATERDVHEMRRVAVRVELRDARGPETEMHLLEVLLVDRQSGTRIRGATVRRRRAAGELAETPPDDRHQVFVADVPGGGDQHAVGTVTRVEKAEEVVALEPRHRLGGARDR